MSRGLKRCLLSTWICQKRSSRRLEGMKCLVWAWHAPNGVLDIEDQTVNFMSVGQSPGRSCSMYSSSMPEGIP